MRLLLDEMWPAWMAESLRVAGHDVAAVLERTDLQGSSDDLVFAAAQGEQRAVVTENVPDYRRLASRAMRAGDSHSGLVLTANRSWPRHRRATFGLLTDALNELLSTRPSLDALADQEWWP